MEAVTNIVVALSLVLTPAPVGQRTQETHSWPVSPPTVISADRAAPTSPLFIPMDWPTEPSFDAPTENAALIVSPPQPVEAVPIVQEIHPSDNQLYRLRMCESTNRYDVNTGNGYYGAVQWLRSTWNAAARSAGRDDLVGVRPDLVGPADQDEITRYWWNHSDPHQQWPVCSYRVGAA